MSAPSFHTVESRNLDLTTDRQTLYAEGPGTPARPLVSELDDVYAWISVSARVLALERDAHRIFQEH